MGKGIILPGQLNHPRELQALLLQQGYVASQKIATALYLALKLEKPVLVEGPAGVGKTELAKASASALGTELLRLQCYEGLDESKALYDWAYTKQLLFIQMLRDKIQAELGFHSSLKEAFRFLNTQKELLFSEIFLLERTLLKALRKKTKVVLLIDEVDRSDEEFEAFLMEVLSDYQVSVPELGTVKAQTAPLVILTSNNTRELSEALRRRCLHLFIPFPEPALEEQILRLKVPQLEENLVKATVSFVQKLRGLKLKKQPGIAETIDWAKSLVLLQAEKLDPVFVEETLSFLLKYEEDVQEVQGKVSELLSLKGTELQAL